MPGNLANQERNNGLESSVPLVEFFNEQPNRYWLDVSDRTNGCHRNSGSAAGEQFKRFQMGIRRGGVM